MKFNPHCIRDILIECENSADGFQELYIEEDNIPQSLSKYSWNELKYHLAQCKKSHLFDEYSGEDILGNFAVNDLSPNGHTVLQNIKSNSLWKKTFNKRRLIVTHFNFRSFGNRRTYVIFSPSKSKTNFTGLSITTCTFHFGGKHFIVMLLQFFPNSFPFIRNFLFAVSIESVSSFCIGNSSSGIFIPPYFCFVLFKWTFSLKIFS